MKATKILLMAISLFFVGQTFAASSYDSMKDRTESWLQSSDEPSLRGNRATAESEEGSLFVGAPVHDGLYVLAVLAGCYLLVRRRKNIVPNK